MAACPPAAQLASTRAAILKSMLTGSSTGQDGSGSVQAGPDALHRAPQGRRVPRAHAGDGVVQPGPRHAGQILNVGRRPSHDLPSVRKSTACHYNHRLRQASAGSIIIFPRSTQETKLYSPAPDMPARSSRLAEDLAMICPASRKALPASGQELLPGLWSANGWLHSVSNGGM